MIRVHATCTSCRQQAALTEHDRDTAMDLLDMYGWTDLETHPLCPECASWQGVKTA